MAFIITKSASSNYTPPPEGMHIARCYSLVDLGTQKKSYQGKVTGEARKMRVSFELLGDDKAPDGLPFTISKSWFLSMHEKSSLRRDLEGWRGRPFTPEEEHGFDVSSVLGAYCLLNLVKGKDKEGNDRIYIDAITPLIRGMQKPEPINQDFIFDLDQPDMAAFDSFGDKTKEIIMESKEWKARVSGVKPSMMASGSPAPQGSGFGDMEDDLIPF